MKIRIAVLLAFAVILIANTAIAAPKLNPANGHFYELIDIGSTLWGAANDDAQTRSFGPNQGHLVSITSAEEQTWIVNNIAPPFGTWIGGFQADNSSEPADGWTWINGEVWDYTNWANGEPNDSNGTEDCAQFWTANGWNDHNCATATYQFYVIEYDGSRVIPTLSTWALLSLALLLGIVGFTVVHRRQT